MKQVRNVEECGAGIEVSRVDENGEGASGSEEEQEDDNDLKSLDWLISYRLPAFYSPLFDDSGSSPEPKLPLLQRPSLSRSDEDSISLSKLPTLTCAKQLQGRKHQQQQSNCSTLCLLYRILATSPGITVSLADLFEKFLELNPGGERLSPDWKQSVCNSLLSSTCLLPSNALKSQHVFWTIECDHRRRQQRSAFVRGPLHECLQDSATLWRNGKEKKLLERKNDSKRALLLTRCSKDAPQRLKRVNSDNELGTATPSKRSLTAVITGEHCYQKSASFSPERTPQ